MKALTWHGRRDVRVDTVPDPAIEQPTDAIIRVTSTGLCGSDLHLYEVLGPFLERGRRPRPRADGHRRGGRLRGRRPAGRRPRRRAVQHLLRALLHVRARPADPVRDHAGARAGHGRRAVRLHQALRPGARRAGRVPARAPGPLRADQGARGAAGRSLPASSPTCCPPRGRRSSTPRSPTAAALAVIGLGPIGEMACRIAQHLGAGTVIGLDLVPERLARARAHGVQTIDVTGGRRRPRRRARAHRRPRARRGDRRRRHGGARRAGRRSSPTRSPASCPTRSRARSWRRPGVDRLSRADLAIELVRRGGTVSLSGVYGGTADPLNMLQMFDKQITLRMGQANVRRWIDDILPLLVRDDDPLGVDTFATHHVPLSEAPRGLRDVPEEGRRRVQGGVPPLAVCVG